ncbi:phage tail sheath subtilisin-like domain-containing protein [Bacillus massiliigorillae]|uniref:phage tail sheath subtilisin-like domain-containing protein n=1 Tax=Bacillus massiliigorillae TaxID=1243664 RepID=UPI0003A4B478|nr:phage tail sheath subtilisin-like domain-containing protein [Bacillus massiliigorillae]
MGLPQINMIFKKLAQSGVQRAARGIVGLFLLETTKTGVFELYSMDDIPEGLTEANQNMIQMAFKGGENKPRKVIIACESTQAKGLALLETVNFNYLAIPSVQTSDLTTVATWVSNQRDLRRNIKVILPDHAADKFFVINFTTDDIKVGETTYTTAQYCARIAGLIAGTPPSIATTYQVLNEVDSVKSLTRPEINTAIDNGEFVIFHDGEKVKVGRGVTSLTTVTATTPKDFKKIKIVEILDMIDEDVRMTLEDNYIGKVPNTYDNKVLLMRALSNYYGTLEDEGLLQPGTTVEIDVDAQAAYLKEQGVDVNSMSEQEIKEADTDDKVFIKVTLRVVDAIEDADINVYM